MTAKFFLLKETMRIQILILHLKCDQTVSNRICGTISNIKAILPFLTTGCARNSSFQGQFAAVPLLWNTLCERKIWKRIEKKPMNADHRWCHCSTHDPMDPPRHHVQHRIRASSVHGPGKWMKSGVHPRELMDESDVHGVDAWSCSLHVFWRGNIYMIFKAIMFNICKYKIKKIFLYSPRW